MNERSSRSSGENRRLNPTNRKLSLRRAASRTWVSCSSSSASGFSQKTCLPFSSARAASSACEPWRVAMTTASTSGSSITSSSLAATRENPRSRSADAAVGPEPPPTSSRRAPASANAGTSTLLANSPGPIRPMRGAPSGTDRGRLD